MKERVRNILGSFFISVTLIDLAMLILGLLLRPQQRFGYEVFIYPLIYGMIGVVPAIAANAGGERELTLKQAVVKEIVQMAMTVVLIVAFIFAGEPVNREVLVNAAGVAASVVIIYILVTLIGWFLDARTARVMTEDLKRFQEEQTEQVSL